MSKQHSQKRRARITPPSHPPSPGSFHPRTPAHCLPGLLLHPRNGPWAPSPKKSLTMGHLPALCGCLTRHMLRRRGGSSLRSWVVWLSSSQPFPAGAGERRVPNLQGLQISSVPLACYILAPLFASFRDEVCQHMHRVRIIQGWGREGRGEKSAEGKRGGQPRQVRHAMLLPHPGQAGCKPK